MGIDWYWIKQRPHFIAELLNTQFNVHVMYQHRYGRTGLQKRENVDVNLNPIYVIPRGDRYVFLSKVNAAIIALNIRLSSLGSCIQQKEQNQENRS